MIKCEDQKLRSIQEDVVFFRKKSATTSSISKGSLNASREFFINISQPYYNKYASIVYTCNMDRLFRGVKDILLDLQDQRVNKTSYEEFKAISRTRQAFLKEYSQRLLKNMMIRNNIPKQSIDRYNNQYKFRIPSAKYTKFTAIDNKSQTVSCAVPIKHCFIRPYIQNTITNNNICSKSLMVERKKKVTVEMRHSREGLLLLESIATSKRQYNTNQTVKTDEAQIRGIHNTQPHTLTHQVIQPRISFIDEGKKQFAPAFGCKRRTYVSNESTWNQTVYKEATAIKDKIKLTDFQAVTITRQQSYKKKSRNPRVFSSIFV